MPHFEYPIFFFKGQEMQKHFKSESSNTHFHTYPYIHLHWVFWRLRHGKYSIFNLFKSWKQTMHHCQEDLKLLDLVQNVWTKTGSSDLSADVHPCGFGGWFCDLGSSWIPCITGGEREALDRKTHILWCCYKVTWMFRGYSISVHSRIL